MILNSRYLENRSWSRSLIPYETTKRRPPRWIDGNYHLGLSAGHIHHGDLGGDPTTRAFFIGAFRDDFPWLDDMLDMRSRAF